MAEGRTQHGDRQHARRQRQGRGEARRQHLHQARPAPGRRRPPACPRRAPVGEGMNNEMGTPDMNDTSTLPPPTSSPPPPTRTAPSPRGPSPAVRLAWLIPGAILAIAALAGAPTTCSACSPTPSTRASRRSPRREVDSIDIGNEEGSITVNPSDDRRRRRHRHVTTDGRRPTCRAASSTTNSCPRWLPVFGSPWCRVDFTVEIPADRADDDQRIERLGADPRGDRRLDVDTDNGSIDLEDVSGNVRAIERQRSDHRPQG